MFVKLERIQFTTTDMRIVQEDKAEKSLVPSHSRRGSSSTNKHAGLSDKSIQGTPKHETQEPSLKILSRPELSQILAC